MKNMFLSVATSSLLITTALGAQNDVPKGVASSHKPNEHTVACLAAPTRDCAISSAMQTVIAEELGLERAKVLVGVAQSLIEIGDNERATQTLKLALEEARSVRLTLITREKIKKIAPLFVKAGDLGMALDLTKELQIASVRDKTLAAIAHEAVKLGDLAGAMQATAKMENRVRAFWEDAQAYVLASPDQLNSEMVSQFEERVRLLDKAEAKYRGIVYLAVIADKMGDMVRRDALLQEAEDIFPAILGVSQRARAALQRLEAMQHAGLDNGLVQASYDFAKVHGSRLRGSEIADFALAVGVIEAEMGLTSEALARLPIFQTPEQQADYLSRLVGNEEGIDSLKGTYDAALAEFTEIEGVYERDLARLTLLQGAIANKSSELAISIIKTLEDDDNQALGLSLLAAII